MGLNVKSIFVGLKNLRGVGNANPASETARCRHSMDAMKFWGSYFLQDSFSLLASFRQDLPAKWQRWQKKFRFQSSF